MWKNIWKTTIMVKLHVRYDKQQDNSERDDIFINRLDDCKLLDVMDKIYKKEYDLSAKKYLLKIPTRLQAERMLKTLESAPVSITEMFQRRLDYNSAKKGHHPVWTPTIPVPAIKKSPEYFIEEGSRTGGFHANFPKDAGTGRLLYTTMKPSEFSQLCICRRG